MSKEKDMDNLKFCLDNYSSDFIYIREVGSRGGKVKVDENLEGKALDFKKDSSGLIFLIDSEEIFKFPLEDYQKGFSIAYERIEPTENGIGRRVILGEGGDPYDKELPEPRRSFLRNVWDSHLLEIFFKGRIDLEFDSWWEEPHWKYWKPVKRN